MGHCMAFLHLHGSLASRTILKRTKSVYSRPTAGTCQPKRMQQVALFTYSCAHAHPEWRRRVHRQS
eukprot:4039050-Pleurochrysis_carterae.AAC.1